MMRGSVRICVVSNRTHSPAFTASLAMLMGQAASDGEHFVRIGLTMMAWQSCLPLGREQGVQIAQGAGNSHILFVDDDSVFPPDALRRLFKRDKRIIGTNFVRKQIPSSWVTKDARDREISSTGRSGIQSVGRIGFGLTLIDLSVFLKIDLPWFTNEWSESRGHMTEDTYFCNKALDAGETLWVDHDLSNQVRHAGEFLYGPDQVLGDADVD